MSNRDFILTLLCVCGIASGQLLFKRAAATWPEPFSLIGLATNLYLIIALAIYGIATIAWIYILRTAPLSVAYPLFAVAFIIVPLLNWAFGGEPVVLQQWLGSGLIIVGVTLCARAT
jgi:drug/metabolite transporter (DMT)-like permease